MRILFVMDSFEELTLEWDTSLALAREFHARGHENWIADIPDLAAVGRQTFAFAQRVTPVARPNSARESESGAASRVEFGYRSAGKHKRNET